ncbi:hypothetical protein [Methylosarcina fibrata]|uniref:hypothetical protein n=1 Tax=Methylosarcina fibrata TaxID=105972 RepID=UPI0012F7286A|nr:hypothetical protein [Methylosarcina fibrata]
MIAELLCRRFIYGGEKVYAKNEKALDEARAFNLGTDGNNRRGRSTRSQASLLAREDLVKQYGDSFLSKRQG